MAERAGISAGTRLKHNLPGPGLAPVTVPTFGKAALALPPQQLPTPTVSPSSPTGRSQQLISWHYCLGKASPEGEVGSAGRAGLPQPMGAVHPLQFPEPHKAVRGKLQKMPNKCCLLASTFHAASLNTLPPGSSYHGHFKLITYPRFCRNIFSRNASRVLIFEEDLEISLGLGNIGHHLMKSVWGWSSTISWGYY